MRSKLKLPCILKAFDVFIVPLKSINSRTPWTPFIDGRNQMPLYKLSNKSSVTVVSLQGWHLHLTPAALLPRSLGWFQADSAPSWQSFGPAAAEHLVPAEECGVPEARRATTAREGPLDSMGGPMDEGWQRPARLLPTHNAPQSFLGCQHFRWVVCCPVG